MAATDVAVKFSADISGLNDGVEKAKGLFSQFSANVGSAASSLTSSFQKIGDRANATSDQVGSFAKKAGQALGVFTAGASVTAGAAIAAIEEIGRRAVATVEPIRTAAGAFDQSIQSMSSVSAIASRAGLGLTQLGTSFQNLQTKAREGDAATVTALNAIGLKASEVANLTQEQLAVKMAEAFSTAKDSANKSRAGFLLFGDAAAKLIPLLDQGAASMKELEAANDRAGLKIGDDLKAKIQGTASIFAAFSASTKELSDSVRGGMLVTFQQIKPAIDGIAQAFTIVVQNITALYQWFGELNGAGQRNIASTGALADITKTFAKAVIDATTWVQTWVVKSIQGLADYGVSIGGLGKVASAFFTDFVTLSTSSSAGFYKAYQAALSAVSVLFADLARAATAALSLDVSGAKAALSDFQKHAGEGWDNVKGSFSGVFAGTAAAVKEMKEGARASADALNPVLDKLAAQNAAGKKFVDDGGKNGPNVKQGRDVGNPNYTEPGRPDRDAIAAAQAAVDGRIRVLHRELAEKEAAYSADVKMFGASEDSKFARLQADAKAAFEVEQQLLEQRAKIAGQTDKQREDSTNKIAELQSRYRSNMINLDVASFESMKAKWNEVTSTIGNAFNSQIRGLLAGTTSFAAAFKNILSDLLTSFIGVVIRMGAEWAAGEAARLTATLSGNAARAAAETAASATSFATMAASALKNIATSAGEVFAGVSAFLAPIIGPAAPAAAGVIAAGVEAVGTGMVKREVGAWNVPRIEPTLLHPGEMVMTAAQSGGLRNVIDMARTAMGEGGGGDTHIHVHLNQMGRIPEREITAHANAIAKAVWSEVAKNPSIRNPSRGNSPW